MGGTCSMHIEFRWENLKEAYAIKTGRQSGDDFDKDCT